eukprot:4838081-Amphidinium_carterae.1
MISVATVWPKVFTLAAWSPGRCGTIAAVDSARSEHSAAFMLFGHPARATQKAFGTVTVDRAEALREL